MQDIEKRRARSVYVHSSQDYSDDYKKRGVIFVGG